MSYDTDRYLFYHTQSTALTLTECGITACHPAHAVPCLKYPDHSMHFILEGKGVYEISGKSYTLSAGEGFLIRPKDFCSYTADEKEPWKYIYISFRGTEAEVLMKNAKIGESPIFSFENDEKTQALLYKIHSFGKKDAHQGVDALGLFLFLISQLIPARAAEDKKKKAEFLHLVRAKRYIEDNYAYGIRIEDVAQHACIERSYLYRLFMRYEGTSPLGFLTAVRLMHAASMLKESTRSVSEIASAVGFFDASHFSKMFYEKYKCTPGQFRKR